MKHRNDAYMCKAYYSYTQSASTSLFQAYVKPSEEKQAAWFEIITDCIYHGYWSPSVITHNKHHFTVAYKYRPTDYPDTNWIFVVQTAKNKYYMTKDECFQLALLFRKN